MNDIVAAKRIERLVFEFRGMKVMLDSDLAALYETETKKLKQQVRRNADRFPEDFMFELTHEEKSRLIASTPRLSALKFSSIAPMVFTEQGVSMLSSVLTTKKAVQMNIAIMRAFAQYRALLLENDELRKEIKALDGKLNEAFKFLMTKIDALAPRYTDRKPLGYKVKKDAAE